MKHVRRGERRRQQAKVPESSFEDEAQFLIEPGPTESPVKIEAQRELSQRATDGPARGGPDAVGQSHLKDMAIGAALESERVGVVRVEGMEACHSRNPLDDERRARPKSNTGAQSDSSLILARRPYGVTRQRL